jgi:hypothetical protein
MKNKLILIALTVFALFGIVGAAVAGPVVEVGSSYSVYVEGDVSDNLFSAIGPFNGLPKEFSRSGLILTLTESDTDLGAGKNRIAIDLVANGDLFPASGEQAFVGVGTDGDGLNLLTNVSLDNAIIRLYGLSGNLVFESINLADATLMGNPWDGFFPGRNAVFGIENAGGIGVSHVMFEFEVSQLGANVPEPGGLMLVGAALIGLGAARRRKTGR